MGAAERLKDVGRLLGFAFLFTLFAGVILADASTAVVVQGGGMLLAGLLAAGIVMRFEGLGIVALGLSRRLAGRELTRGIGLGLLIALPALVLAGTIGGVRWTSEDGTLLEYVATGFWTLSILLVPAAAEEVLFRGYPMRVLLRGWGPGVAVGVTALAFAALHAGNPGIGPLAMVNIGLAGVLLGVVYLKTGSLWWATGVHAGWNFGTAFVGDLPVSGLSVVDSPMVQVAEHGRDLIAGGTFGLEGGLAGTVALGLASVLIWKGHALEASLPALAGGSLAPLSPRAELIFGSPMTQPMTEYPSRSGIDAEANHG